MRFLVILTLTFLPAFLPAQDHIKDAGCWASFSLEKEFSGRWGGSFSEEFRFNENVKELGSFFSDAGLDYKLSDNFRMSIHYRFIQKRRVNDQYSFRHRVYADVSYRMKRDKLTLILRGRIQEQQSDIHSSDDGWVPEWYCRQKLSVKYNIPGPWTPSLGAEFFFSFRDQQWDNIRLALGADRKLSSRMDLDLFLMHQREFGVKEPVWNYIFGVGIGYKL